MALLSTGTTSNSEKPTNLTLDIPLYAGPHFDLSPDITILSSSSSPWGTPLEGGSYDHSPQERPLVPTSSTDWEARKEIIGELYMTQNLILNDVMKIMLSKHKFKATARMYKGQFAKWKWSKYNKSGTSSTTTTGTAISRSKSRSATRRRGSSLPSKAPSPIPQKRPIDATDELQRRNTAYLQEMDILDDFNIDLGSCTQLLFANSDAYDMEETLTAYSTYISSWSQLETPWKPPPGRYQQSILQNVRLALDHFSSSRPASGGAVLRRAFLQVELAISDATRDIEAIWDCCLAVPQLVLATGWTDILVIFTRFLHRLTAIKLPRHPIATVACNLSRLSAKTHDLLKHRGDDPDDCCADNTTPLDFYILSAWRLWIDLVSAHRGRTDPATIHLKRGYVILQPPPPGDDPVLASLIPDFRLCVAESLARRGAARTTARILGLERLLARMYLPLFTAEATRRAEGLLMGLVKRMEEGTAGGEGGYVERYMFFSAYHFLATVADFKGELERAEGYRRRSMEGPRDLFWLQTAETLEGYLRGVGRVEEAERIGRERGEVRLEAGEEGSDDEEMVDGG
ncbi:hypothetical protein QBC39DRAFT_409881 [Podospora conica]|nr:hypothetical protein QBC39DRAFT_409881 [Schizothecium conicum]